MTGTVKEKQNQSQKKIDHYNAHNDGLNPNALEELIQTEKKAINQKYLSKQNIETKIYKPIESEQKIFRLAKPKKSFWNKIKETASRYSLAGLFS